MRLSLVCLLVALAGCPGSVDTDALGTGGDDNGAGSGSGAGGGIAAQCSVNADCVAAGAKCCDCPTHAVPKNDPAQLACAEVDCGTPTSCGSPMQAVCNTGKCELQCAPVACEPTVSCGNGFAIDANGCLTCDCAPVQMPTECSVDGDCARVRDDCCGCMLGGQDTAIPQSEVAAHEAMLGCSATPTCPGGNVCAPDLAARCIQGACELVSGILPAGACGRADLPACPTGQRCTVNANDQATMYGVGVCEP